MAMETVGAVNRPNERSLNNCRQNCLRTPPNSALRCGFIARVGQSPNREASQEAQSGCQKKRLGRISSDQMPRFADRPFHVMRLDKRAGPVEFVCGALRKVVYRFRTLANRGRSGMKAPGRPAAKAVHLFRDPGSFLIEQRRQGR
jgi:hypothetical protein